MTDSIAFTDARLVDGTGTDPVDGATVVVEDGEIAASGPSEDVARDADRTVSLGGRTVMPGLIDAHLHLTLPETLPFHLEWADMSPAEHALRAVDAARRCVEAGFTTVRDVGANPVPERAEGLYNAALWIRLPLQGVLIAWAWWYARGDSEGTE